MKKEYTAPEFEKLDLRSPAIMDIVNQPSPYAAGGIVDDWGPSDGADDELD